MKARLDVLQQSFSPTFSFDSDFVFPDTRSSDRFEENGYSRLFRMGLVSKVGARVVLIVQLLGLSLMVMQSRRITRHVDDFLKNAWHAFTLPLRNLKTLRCA